MSEQVLPAQVARQLEEADQLLKAQGQPPVATPPVAEAPVAVEAAPQPAQAADQELAKLRQRLSTLQGKYNAEVPALNVNLRKAEARAQELTEELERYRAQHKTDAQPTEPTTPLVTAQDAEKFGSDLLDVSRRVAQEVAGAITGRMRALEARVGELEKLAASVTQLQDTVGTVAEATVKSNTDTFYARLVSLVPDWAVINADSGWLAWLGEHDVMLGATRQSALDDAAAKLDVERTAAMFNAYKATLAPAQAASAAVNAELQSQVQPGRSVASTAQVPATERVWTQAEYAAAFDHRLTRSRTPQEVAALQAEADLALAQGRVR